jgi:hypothetical protein
MECIKTQVCYPVIDVLPIYSNLVYQNPQICNDHDENP